MMSETASIDNISVQAGLVLSPSKSPKTIQGSFSALEELYLHLERTVFTHDKESLTETISSLTRILVQTIDSAVGQGWSKDNIRAAIPDIRRIHGLSRFGRHIQDWPRGYPGDFEVVNMIVDRYKSPITNLGDIVSNIAMDLPITQQHREKLAIQTELIRDICRRKRSARIASVACGPCRDIESAQDDILQSQARLTLLDFDPAALSDAAARLSLICPNITATVIDIRKFLGCFEKGTDKFDLIYAGGLFDYLNDNIVCRFIAKASRCLAKGGCLLFTNIASGNPYRHWMETMGNWELRGRTEVEMRHLLSSSGRQDGMLTLEPTGLSWIATIQS